MLTHLTIKARLLLMLILPTLGIAGFSSLIIVDKFTRLSTSQQLIKDCDFFVAIGALVHNLQKERGTTVAFVGSKGAKMADKLPILRTATDKTLNALILSMNVRNDTEHNKDIANTLAELNKLAQLRYNANELNIEWTDALVQYTAIVNALLELSNTSSKEVKDDKIMRNANTYFAYVNAKERAGRERAMLAGVFTVNKLDAGNLLKISINFSEYNAGFNQFKQLSTPQQLAFHNKTVIGKALVEVDRLRKYAAESPLGTSLNVDSRYWVNISTARIDLMRVVEDKLVADLQGSAKAIQTRARQELTTVSLITLLVISLTFILIMRVIQSIEATTSSLKASIEGLAAGQLDVNIEQLNHFTEMGEIARALKVLQNVCRDMKTQHWIKENVAIISAQLQQTDNFEQLLQNFMSAVCPLLNIGCGVFYHCKEEQLFLSGSYAYPERSNLNPCFALGEGLVGQCAVEKTPITLSNPPADYLKIGSGLGTAAPKNIVILPILHGSHLLGVLELSSFQAFTAAENALLDALTPLLAINIEALDRNILTTQLLEQAQAQAGFMEKLAEKLDLQTKTLKEQRDEVQQTEIWFRAIIESAPDAMLIADEDGLIILCNPRAEEIFGYAAGELYSKNIGELLPTNYGIRKNGDEFLVEIGISHLPAIGGKGVCICTCVREMSAVK